MPIQMPAARRRPFSPIAAIQRLEDILGTSDQCCSVPDKHVRAGGPGVEAQGASGALIETAGGSHDELRTIELAGRLSISPRRRGSSTGALETGPDLERPFSPGPLPAPGKGR